MAATAHSTSPAGALRWQQRAFFLVTITAAAAWLDVLAFVHLGKVFLSFMSGNLLFVGIALGQGSGALLVRSALALAAFMAGSALGARLAGSELSPGRPGRQMRRTLVVEAALLAVFALLWAVSDRSSDNTAPTLVLIATGAGAMGVQAAIALALHLPNVATVAMTATLAQIGAVAGWRRREGPGILARTPSLALMVPLCLAYLLTALLVASLPAGSLIACGPLVLILAASIDLSTESSPRRAFRRRRGARR
jgi:uncharacterized membrane protein YoaK (UPF0700 family)